MKEQIRVTNRPLNIFGPEMLPHGNDVITALEIHQQVKVDASWFLVTRRPSNSGEPKN
jgi:hypothetical protein